MEQLSRFIGVVNPEWVLAGGFGKLNDGSSGSAANIDHISQFIEWKARSKDDVMTGIKKMCPNAPKKYFKGCGGRSESVQSLKRSLQIGHNLYGFCGMDNPFIDDNLQQRCNDMAEMAARSQQGSGGDPEPWPFDWF